MCPKVRLFAEFFKIVVAERIVDFARKHFFAFRHKKCSFCVLNFLRIKYEFFKKSNLFCGQIGAADAFFVFSRRHACVMFEYVIEMRQRIKTQPFRNLAERDFFSDQAFRFVRFQFQIGLIDGFSRLFFKKRAKMRFAVMNFVA